MKKIIALVMVVSICILSLTSCGAILEALDIEVDSAIRKADFPKGYTGGLTNFEEKTGAEVYWLETYKEAAEAIKSLKSHGSTFDSSFPAIFNYEGDMFDLKYCFIFNGQYGTDKDGIYGDDQFDRRVSNVQIVTYAFLEDVTIDELVYSYVSRYNCYRISMTGYSASVNDEIDFLAPTEVNVTVNKNGNHNYVARYTIEDKDVKFYIGSVHNKTMYQDLSEEAITSLLSTVVPIDSIANDQ